MSTVSFNPCLPSLGTLGSVTFNDLENKVDAVAGRTLQTEVSVAGQVLRTGLEFENHSIHTMKTMEGKANEIVDTIDLLLALSKEFVPVEGEMLTPSVKAQALVEELKKRGIELVNGPLKPMNKEQVLSLKSLISSHIEQSRTLVQQLFTKIQTVLQNMTSINDTVRKILDGTSELIGQISRNARIA